MVSSSSRAGALGFLFCALLVAALLSPHIPAVEARLGGIKGFEARALDDVKEVDDEDHIESSGRTLLHKKDMQHKHHGHHIEWNEDDVWHSHARDGRHDYCRYNWCERDNWYYCKHNYCGNYGGHGGRGGYNTHWKKKKWHGGDGGYNGNKWGKGSGKWGRGSGKWGQQGRWG